MDKLAQIEESIEKIAFRRMFRAAGDAVRASRKAKADRFIRSSFLPGGGSKMSKANQARVLRRNKGYQEYMRNKRGVAPSASKPDASQAKPMSTGRKALIATGVGSGAAGLGTGYYLGSRDRNR